MHREQPRTERCGAPNRALDRLGDVVELQVEEDGQPARLADGHRPRPRLHEELEPDLHHPDRFAHAQRRALRFRHAREVEREDDGARGAHGYWMQLQSGSPD